MKEERQRQTVLLVDDEPANIRILLELLKSDYEIKVAINGETALEIVTSDNPPDLVLLDVMMPGIDGYEVCRRMKSDQRTARIPVIFITVKTKQQDESMGFEIGAVDYIMKPFVPAIVKARVRTHAELKKYRDYLEELTFRDGLTGIANRRRFDEFLSSTWDLACRESSVISVVMIDIDYFKRYNDYYGHQEGDKCLKMVAGALESSLRRKVDLVARYGGEEFACIMPSTNLKGATLMAEQFRQNVLALKIPHDYSPVERFVSVSLGVASVNPTSLHSQELLIGNADEALYQAKKTGRNRVKSFV